MIEGVYDFTRNQPQVAATLMKMNALCVQKYFAESNKLTDKAIMQMSAVLTCVHIIQDHLHQEIMMSDRIVHIYDQIRKRMVKSGKNGGFGQGEIPQMDQPMAQQAIIDHCIEILSLGVEARGPGGNKIQRDMCIEGEEPLYKIVTLEGIFSDLVSDLVLPKGSQQRPREEEKKEGAPAPV